MLIGSTTTSRAVDASQIRTCNYEAPAGPFKLFLQVLEELERVVRIERLRKHPRGLSLALTQADRVFPALHELLKSLE